MAALSTAIHRHVPFNGCNFNSVPTVTSMTKLKFRYSPIADTLAYTIYPIRGFNPAYRAENTSIAQAFKQNREDCCEQRNEFTEFVHTFKRWFQFVRDVSPGGSWWSLSDLEENIEGFPIAADSTTLLNALSKMWELVADEKWILYMAFGALTVAALSEISIPGILAASVFSAQNGDMSVLYQNSRLLMFLCITSGISSGLRSGCFAIVNLILVKRLRESVYSSLLFQDISFFNTEAVGNLTSRISTDCQRLSYIIGSDVHMILRNILQGTGAFITLMTLSWPLALSSLVVCFILSVIFLFYGQYQKKAALLAQNMVASANEVAQETLSSMRTIRAYGTEREEFQRYTHWIDRLAFVGVRESAAYGLWTLSFHTLYRSTQVLAVALGGISILTGRVSAEQLTKYVLYCEWLIFAAWRLQDKMSSLLQSVGACEKVFQLMQLSPSSEFLSNGVKLQKLKGHIDFVNVSFHYTSRKTVPILDNVNFSIKPNEVVAIVGASGSGKSTLISLLLRLYEPISGEIFIDDIPLKEMDIRWLRENIGFVGQEPHLFHMDVKSNIGYGCSRSIDQEEMEYAAKNAYAHGFISALPNGYDTIIDDNLLSGGQKQRIAIARALLRDPIILVLDEPTSALDAESEGYIKDVLRSLKNDSRRGRTVIIIAQRLSTIKAADRILVLNDGQVVESGSHEELLQKDAQYSRLFKMQTDAQLPITEHRNEGLVEC